MYTLLYQVIVYSLPGYEKFNRMEWGFHNARINCVAWSPDSSMVASGSLDTMIIIWSMTQTNKHIIIKSEYLILISFFLLLLFHLMMTIYLFIYVIDKGI